MAISSVYPRGMNVGKSTIHNRISAISLPVFIQNPEIKSSPSFRKKASSYSALDCVFDVLTKNLIANNPPGSSLMTSHEPEV